jgi:hypothetical protein
MRRIGPVLATIVGIATIATWWPFAWVSLDGERMQQASRVFLAGGDPYAIPGYLYSPLAPILTAPLAMAPLGLAILFLIKVEIVAGYAWLKYGPLVSIAVLVSPPIVSDLVLGNVNVILVAAAIWAISRDRVLPGAVLGILFAAFPKPMLLPIVLWIVLYRRRSSIGWIGGLTVSSAIAAVIAGPSMYVSFIALMLRGGDVGSHFVGNAGLTFADPAAGFVVGLTAIAVFLWSLRTCDPSTSLMIAAGTGMLVGTYQALYSSELIFAALPLYAAAHPERARLAMVAAFGSVLSLTASALMTLGGAAIPVPRVIGASVAVRTPQWLLRPLRARAGTPRIGESSG